VIRVSAAPTAAAVPDPRFSPAVTAAVVGGRKSIADAVIMDAHLLAGLKVAPDADETDEARDACSAPAVLAWLPTEASPPPAGCTCSAGGAVTLAGAVGPPASPLAAAAPLAACAMCFTHSGRMLWRNSIDTSLALSAPQTVLAAASAPLPSARLAAAGAADEMP
jgi:hypothetical protein